MMALEESATSIHQAAKDGELELLSKFPKKRFNQMDKDGWTAVHWCAWAGNVDPLELALSKGYGTHHYSHQAFTRVRI